MSTDHRALRHPQASPARDVQLLNNGRILSSREAYEDHDDPDLRRHLLRLWIAAYRFASLEQGLRQGIGTTR